MNKEILKCKKCDGELSFECYCSRCRPLDINSTNLSKIELMTQTVALKLIGEFKEFHCQYTRDLRDDIEEVILNDNDRVLESQRVSLGAKVNEVSNLLKLLLAANPGKLEVTEMYVILKKHYDYVDNQVLVL